MISQELGINEDDTNEIGFKKNFTLNKTGVIKKYEGNFQSFLLLQKQNQDLSTKMPSIPLTKQLPPLVPQKSNNTNHDTSNQSEYTKRKDKSKKCFSGKLSQRSNS